MSRKDLPDIKGFQQITLIDWEGRIASIIFLGGCNLRCGFCHSSPLVLNKDKIGNIDFEFITDFQKQKKGWVDGVVITGGEPTLDEEALINLISAIRELGLSVKLDTNGTRPKTLKRLIDSKAIEYIAMDIKAPLRQAAYSRAAGVEVEIADIIESKDLLLNSSIDYEFRTTIVPGIIGEAEIRDIAESIKGAKRYRLQQFVPREPIDKAFLKVKPYSSETLDELAAIALTYVKNVVVRK